MFLFSMDFNINLLSLHYRKWLKKWKLREDKNPSRDATKTKITILLKRSRTRSKKNLLNDLKNNISLNNKTKSSNLVSLMKKKNNFTADIKSIAYSRRKDSDKALKCFRVQNDWNKIKL